MHESKHCRTEICGE